jgi:glutamine synthetase
VSAYYEIRLEQYAKTMEIEMAVLQTMLWEGVLPAISRQIALEGSALSAVAGSEGKTALWDGYVAALADLKVSLIAASEDLDSLQERLQTLGAKEQADLITVKGIPLCARIRELCDSAEKRIARDIWPYHTYTDLLTIA